jgi:hypothetical protein
MANYHSVLDVTRKLNLSKTVVNYRALVLGFNRFQGQKRILNDIEVEEIRKFKNRDDLRLVQKYSPKKINVIDFYLTHQNNTCVEIAEKMEISVNFVSTTVNEWFKDNTITVASKI